MPRENAFNNLASWGAMKPPATPLESTKRAGGHGRGGGGCRTFVRDCCHTQQCGVSRCVCEGCGAVLVVAIFRRYFVHKCKHNAEMGGVGEAANRQGAP